MMNPHTLKVLEFDRIVEHLHNLCYCRPAKRMAIVPSNDRSQIECALDCVDEMLKLYRLKGGPPSLAFDDIDLVVEKALASGDILEPAQLLQIVAFYEQAHEWLKLDREYTNLRQLVDRLRPDLELAAAIRATIQPPNEVKDQASPELRRLRREIAATRDQLEAKFRSYLESPVKEHLADLLYTVRDGRYVLPVREGSKGKIKGIVHDRSSTGATFFIEPFETVELNNSLRELETKERQEVYRLLRQLTDRVCANIEDIRRDVDVLATLDIMSAKARYALAMDCSRPVLDDDGRLVIKKGFHPLLRWRDKQNGTAETVPLDLSLGEGFTVLVITGPNTGGKTVALKTVGLLCLMVQAGMFVPVDEGSRFPVYADIFADIGDEQSLEASLSTFSAHLLHIREAIENASRDRLVLLDELGAGTDPDEGAALGESIVEELAVRRVPAIVTTHHGRLKALAVRLPGVQNGSLDFDQKNMRPTYHFRLGVPGLSYAIHTARKLGLKEEVTARAESLLDHKERELSALIAELSEKLRHASDELALAEQKRQEYELLIKEYSEKLNALKQHERQTKKEALLEMQRLLREARRETERLIEEAKKAEKKLPSLRELKHELSARLECYARQAEELDDKQQGQKALGAVGENVYLPELKAHGQILEPPDKEGRVKVRIGNVCLVTSLDKLLQTQPSTAPAASPMSQYPEVAPSMQIDLRGMTFDEAEPVLDRYLDEAYLAGYQSVVVIHGKGTGALRSKIHNHLKDHFRVKSFRLGNWDEGSYGVTVVELKQE